MVKQKAEIDLKGKMYRLDWIEILRRAVDMRPTSFRSDPPFWEWRNASDEICYAVVHAMEDAGIVPKIG